MLGIASDYRVMTQGTAGKEFTIGLNETKLGIVAPFWYVLYSIFLRACVRACVRAYGVCVCVHGSASDIHDFPVACLPQSHDLHVSVSLALAL